MGQRKRAIIDFELFFGCIHLSNQEMATQTNIFNYIELVAMVTDPILAESFGELNKNNQTFDYSTRIAN